MSATSPTRPVSSKARGICKYYLTSRGCWAGDQCKFLHGGSHTPYDLSKTCRFYARGFCKHGAKCWFSHDREALIEEEDDLCSICFEKPVTYGLLTACNHIFCITCIKQWRSASNPDVVESGNTKRCPMCRTASKFIIPSSKFYVHGQSGKDEAITRYKASMKRIPCKHFQRSLDNRSTPFCKYGRDCFYLHRNIDGSEYVPAHGIDTFHFGISNRVDLIRSLENVFAETARLGLATPFPAGGGDDDITVMHRLELLADQMLASLAEHDLPARDNNDDEERMPPLQPTPGQLAHQNWPRPTPQEVASESDDNDIDMPMLVSVSNSFVDSDDEDQDSSAPVVRAFDLGFNHRTSVPERLSNNRRTPNDPTGATLQAEPETPAQQPLFVTDGRGRVVAATAGTGPRPDNSESSDEEAARATRSFLARVLEAIF